MFINLLCEIHIMIDKKHRWYPLVDDNFYEEIRVLNSVTKIHKKYLEEKASILEVKKEGKIVKKIKDLEDDLKLVNAVLGEIIKSRLNKGYTMIEYENLQAFGFYIKDLHIVIDSIWHDINYMYNRLDAIKLTKERKVGLKRYKTEIIVAFFALGVSVIISIVTMVFEILSYYR